MATKYEGHPHYVPIIKWQMWEQRALKELLAPVAARTLPCIEARLPAQHASMLANFANVWKQAALIDYSDPEGKLTPTRLNELIQFLKLVGGSGLLSIPVLNPVTAATDFPLISPHLGDRNIAFRLRLSNIEHIPYGIAIVQAALAVPGLAAKANRLIVDLGPTPAYGATEKNTLAGMLLALKGLGFVHIHLASGAFPVSLAHINGAGQVKRKDWDLWASVEALAPAALVGFSDYGPLSPNWSEETLTRRGSRVTIRYALDDKWRIVRGQYATKAESNAISSIFLTSYPAEFQGKLFSFGDRLIADRVDPTVAAKDKTGGHYHITEFWTHHISYVLQKQY